MAEEFKNVTEHENPKVATQESSATTGEVKDRGLFDFLGKKEEVKHQETPLESEFEHKAQISEPHKHEEEGEKENKPTLLEKLHLKHEEEEEENKPNLLEKLHRSNSSSSSSSEEEGEGGEKRKKKKEKKKIVQGDEKTEEEKKGIMGQIKEKLPCHGTKPEDDAPVVNTVPVSTAPVVMEHTVEHPAEHTAEHPAEKKGILEKIKEKLPGYHAKTSEEEEKKERV